MRKSSDVSAEYLVWLLADATSSLLQAYLDAADRRVLRNALQAPH